MHEQRGTSENSNGGSVAVGFLIGAAVGAGVALLLAPASGAHTRRRLGRVAESLRSDLNHGLGEVRDRLVETRDDVSSALDAGRQAFAREREGRLRADHAADGPAAS